MHIYDSYLSEIGGKSIAVGHLNLTKKYKELKHGPVITLSSIIKHVISSIPESDLEELFCECKSRMLILTMLEEVGHPQTPTPVTLENSTEHDLITQENIPKAPKSMYI